MSQTYMHYATSSSLPSDYAILSRYAAARSLDENTNTIASNEELEAKPSDASSTHQRRSNFPTPFIRPLNPTIASRPDTSVAPVTLANEFTPLLVPRIEEESDDLPGAAGEHAPRSLFWEELRILMKYTLPVYGTHVLEYSFVIASVVSLGHLSTTALAASTLGSMTASVSGFSIIQGFTSTLDTMLPSAWTSSHPELVGLWSQRMAVVMSITLIPIFAIWFSSESILLGLRQDPEVAHLAAVYLKWVSIGLPAYAFNCISRRYFQSQGLFAVPTRVISAIAPINALLNYLLVWGPKPISLGFIGAPIATAISFNLVSLVSIAYGVWFVPRTAWHPLSRRSFTNLGLLVQLGLAGVGQTASEWWSWELIGHRSLGPVALATQSVLLVSASTAFQAPFALSVAASVRIGNLLGEQNAKRAALTTQISLLLALALAGISSTIFLVFRHSWGYLFNNDPAVIALVASILPLVSLFQVFDALSAVTGGVLRARGKQFTGALLNLSAYYVIGIPFGLWLTFRCGMKLQGLWIGLTVSLVYCAVVGVHLCLATDWDVEVRKVMDRLAMDKQGHQDIEQSSHS
ncbi:multidrug flippase [Heterobasidion irregulare TC 32-1]|uniref:Multidrug flippase n=1 Tax=Heterobasidion irregulare (strain TC 32-1) TaxID=747525 RepID=W4JR77_HETIT|nr:multidrug flippase [Heterobasidion irregulare TC 32-1]ETW75964.1 multidrug flippase [Heterobasidion irregulare TC 32-1]